MRNDEKTYLKIIKKNATNIKDLPQTWTSATRKLIRNIKNAMSRMLESCKEKCWRKVAKNHPIDWKQQHLQAMQAMTLICIAKHQQEEKMEEHKKRRCKEKKNQNIEKKRKEGRHNI